MTPTKLVEKEVSRTFWDLVSLGGLWLDRAARQFGGQVVWGFDRIPISRCAFPFVSVASAGAGISGLRTTGSRDGPFPLSALREAQNLALTGLNLIAREEDSCARASAEGDPGAFPLCPLPGAVHLLPLVQFFVGSHCRALQDSAAARRSGAPGGSPSRSSCGSTGPEAGAEDSLCSLESCCVASLGVLQHLVCHSGAVVRCLLSGAGAGSQSPFPPGDPTSAAGGLAGDQGQHPLLEALLRLLAFSSAATGHLPASLLSQCLKVLVKLAENSPSELLPRYHAPASGSLCLP